MTTTSFRDSLGGNGLTMICCTASPHAVNREETKSTLRFGEMAKKIQTEAVVNRMVSRKEMESQINELREQLQYHRKLRNQKKKGRFTSTDFRVLHSQLADATKRADESTQKYLEAEIQLLVKTQYTLELETMLNEQYRNCRALRAQLDALKKGQITVDQLEVEWLENIGKNGGDKEEQKEDEQDIGDGNGNGNEQGHDDGK